MRHGETYWNKKGLIQGSSDIELTPYGIELAQKTGAGFFNDHIFFDRIYTSPYIRAVKTAETVAEHQTAPILVDDRIREMAFGNSEGQPIKDIVAADENIRYCFSTPSKYIAPNGSESFEEVYARVRDFFQTELLPLEQSCDTVLIVCHGALIRSVLTWIKGMDLDDFWTIHQPNCCVNLLELKDGVFSVKKENILYYELEESKKRGIL